MNHTVWKSASIGCALLLTTLAPGTLAHAEGGQNGTTQNGTKQNNPPSPAATPELDSVVLFGVGALGLLGPTLAGRRAKKTNKSTKNSRDSAV